MENKRQTVKLKYVGKWDFYSADVDPREWQLLSSWIDANGNDRKGGNFGLLSLKKLGIIP